MESLSGNDLVAALDRAAESAASRDGVDAAHAAFGTLSEAVGADLFVSIYFQAIDRLWLVAQAGYPETLDGIPLGKGVIGRALNTGEAQVILDPDSDEDLIADIEGIEVEVVVPVGEFVVNFEFTCPVTDLELAPFVTFAETVISRMTLKLETDPRQLSDGHAVVAMVGLNNPVLIAEYAARLAGQGFGLNIVQCVVVLPNSEPISAAWRQPGSEGARTVSTEQALSVLREFAGLTVGTTATPKSFGWGEYNRLLVVPFVSDGVLIGGVLGGGRSVGVSPSAMAHLSMLASQATVCIGRVLHEEEMRRTLDARAAFMAAVSHELRTPLTAMIGYAELLRDHSLTSAEDRSEYAEAIRANADHLLALINDLLDVAQAESGSLAIGDLVECSLGEAIDESIHNVSLGATDNGVEIVFAGTDALVRSHAMRLRQILINLLSNAVKFTDQGKIFVSIDVGSSQIRVEVVDSGCGIDPDVLVGLFQPFQRGPAQGDRAGTGLGLVISRRLAEAMGGSLNLYSDGPGTGTTAVLTIPSAG